MLLFVQKWNKKTLSAWRRGLLLLTYLQRNRQRIALGAHHHAQFATGLRTALHARDLRDIAQAQRPAAGLAFAAHSDGVALAPGLQGEDRRAVCRRNVTACLASILKVEQLEGVPSCQA
ncbi:Uncharacterised protein [Klebsiella pneumoniae]|nr:Uncharacterised protein [Klebsiella pneumoniae]